MACGKLFLEQLYLRVHGLNKTAAGRADQVIVVAALPGRLIAGNAIGGEELGDFAATAEALKGAVDRCYSQSGQPPLCRPVQLPCA